MYEYEIWYDNCRVGGGKGFDTEEDALEEAKLVIETKLENWESDGAEVDWNKDPGYFEIRIEGGEDDG